MTYALFDLHVDEPLFFYEALICTKQCKELPEHCSPCDYSMKGETCGTSQKLNSTTTTKEEGCECEKKKEWCEDEAEFNDFETIGEGFSDWFVIGPEKPSQTLRFQFDKACHGIHLNIESIYGQTVVFFDKDLSVTRGNLVSYPEATICPRDFFYNYGTYTITVFNFNQQLTKFRTSIEFFELGKETEELQEINKCPDSPIFYCPEIGVPYGNIPGAQLAPMFFKIKITKCTHLAMHREMMWSSLNVTGEMGVGIATRIPVVDNKGYHLVSPRTFVFGVCPAEGEQSVDFIVTLVNLAVNYTLGISFYPYSEDWRLREFSSYSITDLFRNLVGLFDVECGGKKVFTCRKGSYEWGLSCLEAWAVVPTTETTGLWPRPLYLLIREPQTFSHLPFEFESEVTNMKVSGGLFLEIVTESEIIRPFPNWRTELEQNCSVNFRDFSVVTTKQGIPVSGRIGFKDRRVEPVCNFESFLEISQEIDELSEKMAKETDSYDILATRYIMDMNTFTPTWLGCQREIEGYLEEVESKLEFVGTTACPPELLDQNEEALKDPCCNSELSWTTCCSKRTISFTSKTLRVPDQMTDEDYCGNFECMKPLLEDYIFYHELRDSIQGCSSAIQETLSVKHFNVYKFYRKCKEEVFGEDGYGKDCLENEDCFYEGRETGSKCDLTSNKCVFSSSKTMDQGYTVFFECLDETMPVSVREYLGRMIEEKGNGKVDETESFVEKMKNLYVMNECVDWMGRSVLSRGFHQESVSADTCPSCDYYCFDRSCLPPWRCEGLEAYGRPNSGCFFAERTILSNRAFCESQMVCNWNSSIETEIECLYHQETKSITTTSSSSTSTSTTTTTRKEERQESSSYFCGYCVTPSSCQMVEVESEEECLRMEGCMISKGNGEVDIVLNVSETECKGMGRCSIDCSDCDRETGCLTSGYCSDEEFSDYLILSEPYYQKGQLKQMNLSTEGYCILPINAWNDPDCVWSSDDVSINIPTGLGCLTFQPDENSCRKVSGSWHRYTNNKESCESEKTCIEPQVLTNMRTDKDQEQCEKCGGDSIPVFDWIESRWLKGEPVKFEWRQKQWTPTHRWESTIDFSSLADDIKESVTEFYSFELQTEAQCRLNPTKNTMEKILCYCSDSTTTTTLQDSCLENKNVAIGVGRLCFQHVYALVAPPSILQFDENSLERDCVEISVETVLMSDIKKPPQASISTSFREKQHRVDSIKNSKGVYVGKFLGNGVSISFSEQSLVRNFTLCLDTEFDIDRHYPDFDFGVRLSEEEIKPLAINVNNDHGTICGVIEVEELENLIIYPIARSSSWESDDDSLTDTEKGIFSFMFVLYFLLFLLKFFEEVRNGIKDFKPNRWIGLLVMACLFVRSLYFIFLLAEAISTTEDTLSEFLLVEIPTYFYFLAIAITAILWSSASGLNNVRQTIRKLALNFTYILIAALCFMISIIVAWKLSGESGSYKCGGRVYEEPDDSTRESIRLAYRIIISLATLAIAGSLTYYGINVYIALDKNLSNTEVNERFQKKILLVGWASTLSLLGQCIFFLCYSQLASPSAEWVLILIPLELLPMGFISLVLGTSKFSTRLTSTRSSSNAGISEKI